MSKRNVEDMEGVVRWGFLGCGKISNDFATAMAAVEKVKIVACASRSMDSANRFADKFNIERRYDSYDALVNDPDVQVIYVGTLHKDHHAHTKLALMAGKGVLCEKPLTVGAALAEENALAAKTNNCFLMEALWTLCFPAYRKVGELIQGGEIGSVVMFEAMFGFRDPGIPRLSVADFAGGAMLDIGVYAVAIAHFACGGGAPVVKAVGSKNEEGVDVNVGVTLAYPGGAIAVLGCSLLADVDCTAKIIGTNGIIKIPKPFHCPESITVAKTGQAEQVIDFALPVAPGSYNFVNSPGLAFECAEVSRCVREGLLESPLVPLADSIAVLRILDECLSQIGVKYPF